MQKNTRAFLLLASLLCAVASSAAQATSTAVPDAGAPAPSAPSTTAPAPKLDSATAADDLTTGTISSPKTREQKLQDCMAIWEPATHMTKAQWKRTCNRQLDEEPRP
jgi:Skp family chaperone for outer membrane proteins